MKVLSIIVPMYKVEPFVERCLRSLEAQNIPQDDYEVICINDGSPDNSRDVVIRLQQEFDNIILIDQENQGVSQARNQGIKCAKGKYLLFVDPDDFIHENCLNQIMQETISKHAQMTIPGYTCLDLNGNLQVIKDFGNYTEKIYTGIEGYFLSHEKGQIMTDLAVGIIFKADLIAKNKLQYVPGVTLNQDCEFIARVHCLTDRCIFVSSTLYTTVMRQGSATRSNQFSRETVRNGFLLAANNLKKFRELQKLNENQKIFLNGPIAKFVFLAIYSGIKTRSIKEFQKIIASLKKSGLEKLKLENCSKYNKICGRSYNLSPYLAILVILAYQKIIILSNS